MSFPTNYEILPKLQINVTKNVTKSFHPNKYTSVPPIAQYYYGIVSMEIQYNIDILYYILSMGALYSH